MSLSPATTQSLTSHRQAFAGLHHKTYFNFGGQGPLPQSANAAITATYQHLDHIGPFSLAANGWLQTQADLIRQAIATELGTTPDTLTFTENVTSGCNIVLWGIDWQPGDHLLMTDCEHPGIIGIISEITRRFQIEVSICPIQDTLNHGNPVAVIESYLRPQTRLVVLSHLLWNTGQVLPLADIVATCHQASLGEYPVQVLVDAAQSVGSLPLNLPELGVDYYAFTGHKWWCGPAGVGGLYVRPERLRSLSPTFIGWRGLIVNQAGEVKGWKPDGRRYEVATSAFPLMVGLQAAIAYHHQWGNAQARYERIVALSQELWQGLGQVPGIRCLKTAPPEAGLVSFQVTSNMPHAKLVQGLEAQGFMLRTIAQPDCVRACVHYFTLSREIEQLITAIQSLVASP